MIGGKARRIADDRYGSGGAGGADGAGGAERVDGGASVVSGVGVVVGAWVSVPAGAAVIAVPGWWPSHAAAAIEAPATARSALRWIVRFFIRISCSMVRSV
ncbi:hypothetical protein BRW65_01840 [Mycobacterium paraffinicum]|uniref:Uncharacterized protein n=1 Tax=Mycobacterium paraffinicum TaxID=53378 RepID=A0A1Q4I2T3_9MYCO|nr:hypothetical protein BRW65_01840 [Mycobacterium paraffinicum]